MGNAKAREAYDYKRSNASGPQAPLYQAVLPFLYDKEIPPDNNASERAIRNMKVKMKVSGQFKSGQENIAVIRSVIDSVKKNAEEILEALVNMAKAQPNYAQN